MNPTVFAVADYDYDLPPERIAQEALPRGDSRLLVLDRATGAVSHGGFDALGNWLRRGDLLVLNDTRVIPARLRGTKEGGGATVEVLLVEETADHTWWTMLRPGKRVRRGTRLRFTGRPDAPPWQAVVCEKGADGLYRLEFAGPGTVLDRLEVFGETPLPPYIDRARTGARPDDRTRYQTVFAQHAGSVAAPTAGLHFTGPHLSALAAAGIEIAHLTLHVGLGTFAPVKVDTVTDHRMHQERFNLPTATADAINRARASGRRVVAVGTTVLRVLEHTADPQGVVSPGAGRTRIFIYPPHTFRVVDALLTNFHLPRSTLLMLVSAFASPGALSGRDLILKTYREAIQEQYRFFSYGDAMFIQ